MSNVTITGYRYSNLKTVRVDGKPVGHIFKSSKNFSMSLDGIFWSQGIPNKTGGNPYGTFPTQKEAIAAVPSIISYATKNPKPQSINHDPKHPGMFSVVGIMRALGQVIRDYPRMFIKGELAQDRKGNGVGTGAPTACKFCAQGFIDRAQHEGLITEMTHKKATDALSASCEELYGESTFWANDDHRNGRLRIRNAADKAVKRLTQARYRNPQ